MFSGARNQVKLHNNSESVWTWSAIGRHDRNWTLLASSNCWHKGKCSQREAIFPGCVCILHKILGDRCCQRVMLSWTNQLSNYVPYHLQLNYTVAWNILPTHVVFIVKYTIIIVFKTYQLSDDFSIDIMERLFCHVRKCKTITCELHFSRKPEFGKDWSRS